MELKGYFRILIKRWWTILPIFAVTLLTVAYWNSRLPSIFSTSATFVIRPRSELVLNNDFVRALDIVSRRVEINTTFAEVASSKMVKALAAERLQLPPEKRGDISVNGRVIGGTNVLEITVQGTDPRTVKDFAEAVGVETLLYISGLYDVFELEPLDPPVVPLNPIRPNRTFNLLMGAALGLVLGIGTTFLIEYVETPPEDSGSFNILDRDTGAYNKSYFMLRLQEEMQRAHRHRAPLTLSLIRVGLNTEDQDYSTWAGVEVLRGARILIENTLKDEDLLFRYDEDTYAILMPERNEKKAKELTDQLNFNLAAFQDNFNGKPKEKLLKCAMGVLSVYDNLLDQEELLDLTFQALEQAMYSPNSEVVHYYIDNNTPINLINNRRYQDTR